MNYIEAIGYVAALCFAVSGIPFAIRTHQLGKSDASTVGILLILGGSAGMLSYELLTSQKLPLLLDFAVNMFSWSVVLRYKMYPVSTRQ